MCNSIGKSTETDRCLEREKAWENFWESIAKHDPTGELSLLNGGIDHGAEEGSSEQTEKQHEIQEASNSGKRKASDIAD